MSICNLQQDNFWRWHFLIQQIPNGDDSINHWTFTSLLVAMLSHVLVASEHTELKYNMLNFNCCASGLVLLPHLSSKTIQIVMVFQMCLQKERFVWHVNAARYIQSIFKRY